MLSIREYSSGDCRILAQLFYDTVHSVNRRDYTEEQVNAWATGEVNWEDWDATLRERYTVVAESDGKIVGFGDMDASGYLDRLYVHKDYQRRGIASLICEKLEQTAQKRIVTHASVTAKPFFEQRGYQVIKEQQVKRQGVWLTNFVMMKEK